MAQSGIAEFKEVLTDFRSLTSWSIGGAVAAPLADLALKLGPPWPPGAFLISSLAEILTLIYIFHFWFRANHKQLGKRMRASVITLLLSALTYLVLFDLFTFQSPSSNQRYTKGFVPKPDKKMLLDAGRSEDEVLRGSEYNPNQVWKSWSITAVHLSLLGAWTVIFISLSIVVGSFVISQRRKRIRQADDSPLQRAP
jgi:hypothetical protein